MSNENERSLREELTENLTTVQDRERDERGRFSSTPNEVADVPDAEIPASDAPVDKSDVPRKAEKKAEATEDPFPAAWKKDYEKHWGSLPPDLKKYIREHEEQTRQAMVKQDDDRLTGKQLREIISPYLADLQALGMSLPQAFQGMLQQNYILRRGTPAEKRALLLSAAQQYGIDIAQQQEQAQVWVDPQIQALQQQVVEMQRYQQQQVQAQQYQERASVDGQIQAFASTPGHEHFPKVAQRMGALMMSNQAQSLEDAYQQAIWADPELRLTLIASQQAEAEAKRAAEAKAKANAARNASGSVRGSSAGSGTIPAAPKGSLREELRAALAATKDR